MNLILNLRIIFYVWLTVHTLLLFISGYMHKIALAFLNMKWETFLEIDKSVYILDTSEVSSYDITDYLLFVFTPLILYGIANKLFFRKYRISKLKGSKKFI